MSAQVQGHTVGCGHIFLYSGNLVSTTMLWMCFYKFIWWVCRSQDEKHWTLILEPFNWNLIRKIISLTCCYHSVTSKIFMPDVEFSTVPSFAKSELSMLYYWLYSFCLLCFSYVFLHVCAQRLLSLVTFTMLMMLALPASLWTGLNLYNSDFG